MVQLRLADLARRLDADCRVRLERAAEICQQRGNSDLDVEHWLAALLDGTDSAARALLDRIGVDSRQLMRDLLGSTLRLPGTGRALELSPRVGRWIETAFLFAAVTRGRRVVTVGDLLVAVLDTAELREHLSECTAALDAVDVRSLQRSLPAAGGDDDAEPAAVTDARSGGAIARFTTDLTALAAADELEPVVGRDREIQAVVEVVLRRRQNNPILTGDAGVGKTAIVEGLARRLVGGEAPERLRDARILALDLCALQAGASERGEFEQRLHDLLAEIRASSRPIVLFVDEVHMLIGAGGAAGTGDAANQLKPALARGELRMIAATTDAEYKRHIEKDAALRRRFHRVRVGEPDPEQAMRMVGGVAPVLERHHGVRIDADAITAAVELSVRYLQEQKLPDKAITVLDTAAARAALAPRPAAITGAESQPPAVDRRCVAGVIADATGVPAGRILRDPQSASLELGDRLRARLFGQDQAMLTIGRQLQAAAADLVDPGAPRGVFLLAGPSGVGKTETARALADELYGGADHLVTVNLSEFQEAHTVSLLKGAPPGYVGFGDGGVLTEAIRRRPYSVVLLDEIEKAHPDVLELFYQIMDAGTIDDSEGQRVDFANTVVVLTTNLGAEYLRDLHSDSGEVPDYAALRRELVPELQRRLPAAFVGRTALIPFLPLDETALARIVDAKVDAALARARVAFGRPVTLTTDARDSIVRRCVAGDVGARAIDDVLRTDLLPELAVELFARTSAPTTAALVIDVDPAGRFIFESVETTAKNRWPTVCSIETPTT